MIEVRFRAIPDWPYQTTSGYQRRSRNTFKAPWSATLDLLDRELRHLRARDVIIECGLLPSDIRIDGWPRSNAREPMHPGVAVHFEIPGIGHVRYATDTCRFWQHNVRSIALGLEALRAVDRYGITQGREQYRGFAQLPAAVPMLEVMSPEDAARFIVKIAVDASGAEQFDVDDVLSGAWLKEAFRLAAKRLHPDQGGNSEDFQKLQAAKRIIEGGLNG